MNKKAVFELAGEMVIWIYRIFMLLLVLVSVAIFVGAYVNIRMDTSKIEHRIIVDKILMQQGCINFYDGVRWNSYSIDAGKFNSDTLSGCLLSEDVGVELKISYNNIMSQARYNDGMLGYTGFCNENNNFRCSRGKMIVKVADTGIVYDGLLEYLVITKHE